MPETNPEWTSSVIANAEGYIHCTDAVIKEETPTTQTTGDTSTTTDNTPSN